MRRILGKNCYDVSVAVDVARVFEKCIKIANHISGVRINFKNNCDGRVLVHAQLNLLIAQIILVLENICLNYREADISMTADLKKKICMVDFVCDGEKSDYYFEFCLYTTEPSCVVSDEELDKELEMAVEEAFSKREKLRMIKKRYNELHEK